MGNEKELEFEINKLAAELEEIRSSAELGDGVVYDANRNRAMEAVLTCRLALRLPLSSVRYVRQER